MKFVYHVSPNYRQPKSTAKIMMELTLGLLVVFFASVAYYATTFGAEFAIRAVMLLLVATSCAVGTEIVWCVFTKKDIKTFLQSSFPWVTGIILALMCRVDTSYYALGVSTVLAIFFGKLVFGGFGQNIFNPAAVGRAIIFNSFSANVVADLITSATPTTALNSSSWLLTEAAPSLSTLLLGNYVGSLGETSFVIIVIVGIVLAIRGVIDYRTPLTYLVTLFLLATMFGVLNGQPLTYGLYHLAIGGAAFGAVFMMTDPVTNPTSPTGRVIFSMGCALITLLLRLQSNLPEGVLYSILIMNALTPALERFLDSNQIKDSKRNNIAVVITAIFSIVVILAIAVASKADTASVTAFKSVIDSVVGL